MTMEKKVARGLGDWKPKALAIPGKRVAIGGAETPWMLKHFSAGHQVRCICSHRCSARNHLTIAILPLLTRILEATQPMFPQFAVCSLRPNQTTTGAFSFRYKPPSQVKSLATLSPRPN